MESGEEWYTHAGHDLHLVDLLFQARIQTACWLSQCVDCFPNRDRVLERLMAEGLFNQRKPDHIHIAEVRANWLSVALTERVLERVENLEGRVSVFLFDASAMLIPCLGGGPSFPVGCSGGIRPKPSHHSGEAGDPGRPPGGEDPDLGRSTGLGPEPSGLVPLHKV